MRECGLEPLQFNCFCATMRLYNSLTQFRILLGTSERERERERERDTRSFGHPTLPNGCPREHNSKTLITDGVHYKISLGYSFSLQPSQVHVPRPPTRCHSQCWPFQTACPHPSLWDRNMEPQLLPYLWFVWGWWRCPWWTARYFPLHTPPYSVSSQEIWVLILKDKSTGCFHFFASEQQQTLFFSAWTVLWAG